MPLWQNGILAVVQGLAELLPVSSSAHVIVVQRLLGLDPGAPEMTFLLVMLHTGTMFRHFAGAPADVDDHVGARLLDTEPRAESSSHRFLDQVHFPGTGLSRRVADGSLLDLGDAGWYGQHDARMDQALAPVDGCDEVVQHLLGDVEVCDHSVS